MSDEVTIGARLRVLRRWRGMTLKQLADLSGLSIGFLSNVENGKGILDRRSHIAAITAALRVSEVDLVGRPQLGPDPVQAAPHARIPALRTALQANGLMSPTIDRARPLDELCAALDGEIKQRRQSSDYATIGELLPDVLDELHLHVADPADEAAQQTALEALVEACVCATFTAKNLGYPDLAHAAAVRAGEAAHYLGDPTQLGKAAFLKVQTIPKAAQRRALVAAEREADRLESHAAERAGGVEALGMLILSASLIAATLHDKANADHWLDEAAALAARIPDEPQVNWQSFSATNVGAWRVHIGVEHGIAGTSVLDLAEGVEEGKLDSPRRAAFLADVGRGLARDKRTHKEAVGCLNRAERVAPQRIRNSATAREAVAVMLSRAQAEAGGRELRGMAARMGVLH